METGDHKFRLPDRHYYILCDRVRLTGHHTRVHVRTGIFIRRSCITTGRELKFDGRFPVREKRLAEMVRM